MGSDTRLVARAGAEPSRGSQEGDRTIAWGRPSIPAAWLALLDAKAVALAGSKPKFVALVTERVAGLARLRARRARLLRIFTPTLAPQLDVFERAIASATEDHLHILLDQTYIDWTGPKMVTAAKQLIRLTDDDDLAAWQRLFAHFDGEHAFAHPGFVVGALCGWVSGEPCPQDVEHPPETVAALADLRAALYPETDPAALRAELVRSVDAMRSGVVRAAVFRHELDPDSDEDLALLDRATLPPTEDPPRPDPLTADDRARLLGAPLPCPLELRLLIDPKTYDPTYWLVSLAPALFRGLRGALIAGTALPIDRYALELLGLLTLLGGDAELGVLTLICGREHDGTAGFMRALATLHAYGVWAVATLEHGDGPWTGVACAAPLLVLARLRLRLRARWDPSVDLAAPRFPAWTVHSPELLAETSRRADALADFIAAVEAPGATLPTAPLVPGALVLQKKRGVTVAFSIDQAKVTVAGFAHPENPYPRVAAAYVTALELPASVGRVFIGAPRGLPT